MNTYKIKAFKDSEGKKSLCIHGLVTGKELNAIKKKMKKMGVTVSDLSLKTWIEIDVFDYDFDEI